MWSMKYYHKMPLVKEAEIKGTPFILVHGWDYSILFLATLVKAPLLA